MIGRQWWPSGRTLLVICAVMLSAAGTWQSIRSSGCRPGRVPRRSTDEHRTDRCRVALGAPLVALATLPRMVSSVPVDESRRLRWEARAEWPLTAAALVFLIAYAWPILDPDLSAPWRAVLRALTWTTWALFALDYAARLTLSSRRGAFVRHNVFDLLVVALPLLRPLRLLRLVNVLAALNRHAGSSLRGRVVTYAVGGTVLIVLVGALAGLDAERTSSDANITSFGDAVWWALATITTVGYGDQFPGHPDRSRRRCRPHAGRHRASRHDHSDAGFLAGPARGRGRRGLPGRHPAGHRDPDRGDRRTARGAAATRLARLSGCRACSPSG